MTSSFPRKGTTKGKFTEEDLLFALSLQQKTEMNWKDYLFIILLGIVIAGIASIPAWLLLIFRGAI